MRKVLWACSELSIDYGLDELGRDSDDLQQPEFRQLNPNSMVPVIIDGDFVLWQSNTICRYLASSVNNHELLPSSPKSRALIEQWMDWQATELNDSWRYAFMSLVRQSPECSDEALTKANLKSWNHNMAILSSN